MKPLISVFQWLAIAVVGASLSACGNDGVETAAPSALLVATYTVTGSDAHAVTQRFSGQVEASRQSSLGFEIGGELAQVLVDEGAEVSAGEVIARLDQSRLQAAQAEAQAALEQAQAQATLSAATYERVRQAREFDGVSTQEVDEALELQQRTQASQSAAQARLDRINVDIANAVIRAPYPASVIARFADEGQVLAAGQPVVEIQEAAALEVRLAVTGDALESLRTGAQVTLQIDQQPVAATVTAVIARRNLRTRAVEVILAIEAGAPARVGDIAELQFQRTIQQAGYWVPVDALVEGSGGVWNVLAITDTDLSLGTQVMRDTGATHQLKRRPVELLHEEADRVFVRGALQAGDQIVANGVQRVVPGQGVRVGQPADASVELAQEPAP
ncbi:MAG: efflux RND transporter periplasmic adaptor subunit [Pseudomonadota bacterium]